MRRDYEVCLPENERWDVPASLQTILKARGIEITQPEIATHFTSVNEGPSFKRFIFNKSSLAKFLQGFNLNSAYRSPYTDPELYQGTDLFLRDVRENEDILVHYDHEKREGAINPVIEDSRLAVFLDYARESDLVRVTGFGVEPYFDIILPGLVKSIRPKEDDTGFFEYDGLIQLYWSNAIVISETIGNLSFI